MLKKSYEKSFLNTDAQITPKIPIKLKSTSNQNAIGYIYNTIVLIDYLLKQIDGNSDFMSEANMLISTFTVDKSAMGFPKERIMGQTELNCTND